MRRQQEQLPNDYEGWSVDTKLLRDDLVGDLRRPLLIFLGAVAMVLLIVCANVANLLLARGAARERELGVRVALGAGRSRIFGHVLLESITLAVAGGLIGALLAPWGERLFTLAYPQDLPFYLSIGIDGWIVAFVALLVGLSAILMGVIPSYRATSIDIGSALREGGRAGDGGRRGSRTRSILVVSDFRHWPLAQAMRPAIYLPQLAQPTLSQTLVVRTSLTNPRTIEQTVRSVLREIDRDAPAYQVQSFSELVSTSLWRQRLQGRVLATFAVMALILAALGIYGVISYGVTQRTREFGVRMALGATRREVAGLILAQGGRLAAIGIGVGLVAAFAVRKVVEQLLYGIQASDPLTFTAVPLVLAVVALAASVLPALRATRVDPAVAMRAE